MIIRLRTAETKLRVGELCSMKDDGEVVRLGGGRVIGTVCRVNQDGTVDVMMADDMDLRTEVAGAHWYSQKFVHATYMVLRNGEKTWRGTLCGITVMDSEGTIDYDASTDAPLTCLACMALESG